MGCCCGPHRVLRVNVIRAEGLGDYDTFGSIDAFVKISYNGKEKKTDVVKNNKEPKWEQILEFSGAQLNQGELVCTIWDWDRLSPNDYVGEAVINAELPTTYNTTKEFALTVKAKDTKESGKLYIKLEFVEE